MTGQSQTAKAREQAASRRRNAIHAKFAARHPAVAREESQLKRMVRAQAREYGHKVNGTVQTHAHAARVRQGSLARMYKSGHLNADQLAGAEQITRVYERIGRGVAIGTSSYETRVDSGQRGSGWGEEKFGHIRAEMAYSRWRRGLRRPAPVLAMICEDMAVSTVAEKFGMRKSTARALLVQALDAWGDVMGAVGYETRGRDLEGQSRRIFA